MPMHRKNKGQGSGWYKVRIKRDHRRKAIAKLSRRRNRASK